jgi:hypothetical protein
MIKGLFLLVLIFIQTLYEPSENIIYWDERRELKDIDFTGPFPKDNVENNGKAFVLINAETDSSGNTVIFTIRTEFKKNYSWLRPNLQLVDKEETISHEQVHFDIGEVYARRLRKKLLETSFTRTEYQSVFRLIYSNLVSEMMNAQRWYDKETDHSINRKKQKEWEHKILNDLKLLEAFKTPIVNVSLK